VPADLEQLLTAEQLAELSAEVATAISRDHPDGVTLVGVLKGSVPFLADLCRRVTVPTRIEFVALAPYDTAAGRTRVVTDLGAPVAGEGVVVVSGIVDTGFTTDFLLRHLRAGDPASLRVCTLADKRARRILPVPVDYAAFEAPDRFLIGYGLDFAGRYRNLRGLWAADGSALATDPDRHVTALYGRQTG
jgi:hypoxanthine phosphoribosyltransferase